MDKKVKLFLVPVNMSIKIIFISRRKVMILEKMQGPNT